jgi:hypothetical protein
LFLGPDGADPTLGFAADALAAGRQPFVHLFRAVVRYAKAVAKDWRSLRQPGAKAAPMLAAVPETTRTWSRS